MKPPGCLLRRRLSARPVTRRVIVALCSAKPRLLPSKKSFAAAAKLLRFFEFNETLCVQENLDGPQVRWSIRHTHWRPSAPHPFRHAS